jgi:hypothetical protein
LRKEISHRKNYTNLNTPPLVLEEIKILAKKPPRNAREVEGG